MTIDWTTAPDFIEPGDTGGMIEDKATWAEVHAAGRYVPDTHDTMAGRDPVLTVGQLRRLISGLPGETRVVVETAAETLWHVGLVGLPGDESEANAVTLIPGTIFDSRDA